jgi:hypothetical protein
MNSHAKFTATREKVASLSLRDEREIARKGGALAGSFNA